MAAGFTEVSETTQFGERELQKTHSSTDNDFMMQT